MHRDPEIDPILLRLLRTPISALDDTGLWVHHLMVDENGGQLYATALAAGISSKSGPAGS